MIRRFAIVLSVLGVLVPASAAWAVSWSWQPTPVPGPEAEFSAVSCPSVVECLAVGDHFGPHGMVTVAERWGGHHWSTTRTLNPLTGDDRLSGISCPSAGLCMAVGSAADTAGDRSTLAEEWDGSHLGAS